MTYLLPSSSILLMLPILASLIPFASSLYAFKSSYSLYGYSVTSFALSQKNVDVISAEVNMAVGLINGSVMVTNVDNFNNKYMAYPFNTTIQNMDWIDTGIMVQTTNQIKIIEPQYYTTRLFLSFVEPIYASAVAYSAKYAKTIVVVSFSNRIQFFENTTSVMNRSVQAPVRAMTLDATGNYFYYFDAYTRYVIDIPSRNTILSKYYSTNQISITASSRSGHEDITASLQYGGIYLRVWDDYNNIASFSNTYPQSLIKFTGDSQYVVTLQNSDSKITLWRTDFSDNFKWNIAQSFDLTNGGAYYQLDAENDRIVCMANSVFTLYGNQGDNAPLGLILGLVFGVLGLIVVVGVVAFCCRKRAMKKKQQGDYQKVDNQGFNPNSNHNNNQGWNNNTGNQGWNNNTGNQGWGNNTGNQGWGNNTNANAGANQGWFGQPNNNNANSNPYGNN